MTNGCFNGEQDDSSKELCVSHVHANSFNEASNLLKAWQQALTTKIMEPMIKPNAELIKEKHINIDLTNTTTNENQNPLQQHSNIPEACFGDTEKN